MVLLYGMMGNFMVATKEDSETISNKAINKFCHFGFRQIRIFKDILNKLITEKI